MKTSTAILWPALVLAVLWAGTALHAQSTDATAEAEQLLAIYQQTGNGTAGRLAASMSASDRELSLLDEAAAHVLTGAHTLPADLDQLERLYSTAMERRRGILTGALDLLFPPERRQASGTILQPTDPLCAHRTGTLGMYAPGEFLKRIGGGIYLTEPFDPNRDVLLVVHGINGTPMDFDKFIPAMDRHRFQVWMAYYPTGEKIPWMAHFINEALQHELARYPVRRLSVVCHSLGGLVVRALFAQEGLPAPLASVYYVSTPQRGVHFTPMPFIRVACRILYRFLPTEVLDLLEGSPYLAQLNGHPPLSAAVRTAGGDRWKTLHAHLVGPFIAGVDDGLVPLANTTLPGSLSHRVFHEDHYTILSSPDLQGTVSGWLEQDRH